MFKTIINIVFFISLGTSSIQADAWQQFLDNNHGNVICEATVSNGNTTNEIFFMRQIHNNDKMAIRVNDATIVTEKEFANTVKCQWKIFQALMVLQPHAVIIEGSSYSFSAQDISKDKKAVAGILRFFPKDWYKTVVNINQLSEQQKRILYVLGAGYAYTATLATENRGVSMLGVNKQILSKTYALSQNDENFHRWLSALEDKDLNLLEPLPNMPKSMLQWEKVHADVVLNYLRHKKNQRLALVIGAGHRFDRHFKNSNVRLYRVTFKEFLRNIK